MTPQAMPDGALRIEPYEDWLLRDAVGAAPGDRPHGAWTLVGTFRGLGAGLAGLFELVGAGPEDGVMFGESAIEQLRPLEHSRDYIVRAQVAGSSSHYGRTVGAFDLVAWVVELVDDDGVAVRCRNSIVVPRPEGER